MWWWHGMPFGNKVSQNFTAIHDFCDNVSFCVSWIYGTNICHGMPFFLCAMNFWSHEFTYMCMCTKQSIVNCNYDYNINSHFEKDDT
jgi:hypothetical protein